MAHATERRAIRDSILDTPGWLREVAEYRGELVTVAFINRHGIWFKINGVKRRARLRQLLEPTEEAGLLIATLEARGVQIAIDDRGDLEIWVTESHRRQIRYCFNRTQNQTCFCRGVRLSRHGRNSWTPHVFS